MRSISDHSGSHMPEWTSGIETRRQKGYNRFKLLHRRTRSQDERQVVQLMTKDTGSKRPDSGAGDKWREFGAFFKYAHLSWGWIIAAGFVTVVYYLTVTKLPGSTAALFSGNFSQKAITDVIINYSSLMVMLLLVGVVSLLAEARSVRSVRRAVWTRMMGIRSDYYDEHSASGLLSAVTSDAEITVKQLVQVITTAPGLIMYLSQALPQINSFSPRLLWSVLVLIPFYIIYAVFIGRWQYKVSSRIQLRIGGLTGYLTDRIRNLTMIKSFVTEQAEEERGVGASKELYKANINYAYANSVIVAYTILAEIVGIVIAVLWGCLLLRGGEIDLESWLAFYLFVPTINTVLRQLTNIWSNLKDVQGRAARLSAMMVAPQEAMNEGAEDAPAGDISFDCVSFAYREGAPVLDGLSFTLPAGKTTAIVGLSGSGKTTVLRLIEKLYSPQGGAISVGGASLEGLDLKAWRRRLSYVNQDAEMFSGTIREALTYGVHRPISDAELEEAARAAGIHGFIASTPEGYDSQLALWGSTMSGGQRQRMVIARELLKDTDVLLLDEPTSALDSESAANICETLFCSFTGKTVVAVTHELGFITHADQIIVLSGGRVSAAGRHEELMQSCPLYRELVEEQSYQEVFAK